MPRDDELAAAARRRLTAAGRRAQLRADYGAAASLLERAIALVPPAELDLALETDLVDALFWEARAATRSGARIPSPSAPRLRGTKWRAVREDPGGHHPHVHSSRRAQPRGWRRSSSRRCPCSRPPATTWPSTPPTTGSRRWRSSAGRWTQRWRRTSGPPPTLGGRACRRSSSSGAPAVVTTATTPVSELLAWLDEHEPRAGRDHWLRMYRALALAMLGRFDEARPMLAETRAELAERGGGIRLAVTTGIESVDFELLAGDPAAAAELGAEGCRLFEDLEDESFLSTAAGSLAQSALRARPARRGRRLGRPRRGARRERRCRHADALAAGRGQRCSRAAASTPRRSGSPVRRSRSAMETDVLNAQGDAYADLAEVLVLDGQHRRGGRRARAGARAL